MIALMEQRVATMANARTSYKALHASVMRDGKVFFVMRESVLVCPILVRIMRCVWMLTTVDTVVFVKTIMKE
jgi:hypothetical protein